MFYARNGRYAKAKDRQSMLAVMDRAVSELTRKSQGDRQPEAVCDPI